MTKNDLTPRVYVGTYHKYASGSIEGAWLDLTDYSDWEEFHDACLALHRDETDPELMFQDFEGFPERFYSESGIASELWEYLDLDDDDRELLAVYWDNIDDKADFDTAREAFLGKYQSAEDWAASYLEDTGFFAEIPQGIRDTVEMYFDFAAYARDAGFNGMHFIERGYHDVWVFSN